MSEIFTTRDIREKLLYTQEEFAEKFHVSIDEVKKWDAEGMPEYLHYWLEIIWGLYVELVYANKPDGMIVARNVDLLKLKEDI